MFRFMGYVGHEFPPNEAYPSTGISLVEVVSDYLRYLFVITIR
jgi:hypothetical protein